MRLAFAHTLTHFLFLSPLTSQEFELRPVATGNAFLYKTTDLGRVGSTTTGHLARSVGGQVFHPRSNEVRALDEDSNPAPTNAMASMSFSQRGGRVMPQAPAATGAGFAPPAAYAASQHAAAAAAAAAAANNSANPAIRPGQLGLVVMNTHTPHTDGTGVVVTKINRGGPAEASGLRVNDIVVTAHNQPTLTVADFRNVVARVPGPLRLQVNRDGRQNVKITIYRNNE
jgi:hypothetical protein